MDMITNFCSNIPQPDISDSTGDYVKDNVVYCGKCHTPRQVYIDIGGARMVRNCLCKCRMEAYNNDVAAFEARKAEYAQNQRARAAIKNRTYERWTFDQDDGKEPKMAKVRKYAENFDQALQNNIGLLLWGDVGTGKTYAAASVVNYLVAHGYRCYMTTFTELANTITGLRGDEKNEFIRSLNAFHLLVIDDLGAERQSEYMQEMVYQVIDSRYRAGKPVIITTNLTAQEITNPRDTSLARIYSRVTEMAILMQFTHQRRPDKAAKKLSDLAEMLLDD